MKKNLQLNVEDITEDIIMELLMGICSENKMCFTDYRNVCEEEALKEILKGEENNVNKNRKNKSNR